MELFNPVTSRQRLDDRKKIAAIMQAQSATPMDVPQGAAVSWLAPLAKVVQAYMAGREREGVAADEIAYQKQYGEGLKGAMGDYFTQKADPANGRAAIAAALSSPYKELQTLGQSELEATGKDAVGAKDLLKYVNPSQIPALLAGGGQVSPGMMKRDFGEVGGQVYDRENLQRMQLGGDPGQLTQINGDLYHVNPTTGKPEKLDNAPRTSITTNVTNSTPGYNSFDKAYGAAVGKAAGEQLTQAPIIAQVSSDIDTMLDMLDKGQVNLGLAGPLVQIGSKLSNAVGVDTGTKAADTENFRSMAQNLVLLKSSALAGVLTDRDWKNLEAIAAGSNMFEPAAVRAIIMRARDGLRKQQEHNARLAQEYQARGGGAVPGVNGASGQFSSPSPSPSPSPAPAPAPSGTLKFNPVTWSIE